MNFYRCLMDLLKQIPASKLSTYREIAAALGDEDALESITKIVDSLHTRKDVPWHRVIQSDGKIGGSFLEKGKKKVFLESENFKIVDFAVQDFPSHLFTSFKTVFPLKKLREQQESLKPHLNIEDSFDNMKTIGGVDVAYKNCDAFGAYVTMDYQTHNIVTTKSIHMTIKFPYIPTYLAFREMPLIKKLVANQPPSLLMVDGHGLSHPSNMGLASHLGITLDVPSIGVAKNLLCGKQLTSLADETAAPISYKGQIVGWAIRTPRSAKPIYVSPGHRVSLQTSRKIVKEFAVFRIPEPLRQAHLLAREKMRCYREASKLHEGEMQ